MQDLHSDISIEDDVIDLNNKVGNAAFYALFILFVNKNLRVVNISYCFVQSVRNIFL